MIIDWEAVGQEAADLLSSYLRLRTVNPPGNERQAADYLAGLLRERGLESTILESMPSRANLIARLPGDGTGNGIILLHHMDVVPAETDRWSVDPFGGEIRDGFVWGRGAIDMKGAGIMHLLALELLKRSGLPLRREIIFLAVADEEAGSKAGAGWLLVEHAEALQAEYVWDEGGFGIQGLFGPGVVFSVAVAEKRALWLRLTVAGEAGHGGLPHGQNPAEILIEALARVRRYSHSLSLHPVARDFFRSVSHLMPAPQSWLLRNLDKGLILRLASSALLKEPALRAMLQNTVSVTGLRAGVKANVIPLSAEAVLDVRLLPGEHEEEFIRELRDVMADERVQIEVIEHPQPTTLSPYGADEQMYRILCEVLGDLVPGSHVAPLMTPGATDSCLFRRRGYKTYGLFPSIIDSGELARFHGVDERISIANLTLGTRIIYETLRRLCVDEFDD